MSRSIGDAAAERVSAAEPTKNTSSFKARCTASPYLNLLNLTLKHFAVLLQNKLTKGFRIYCLPGRCHGFCASLVPRVFPAFDLSVEFCPGPVPRTFISAQLLVHVPMPRRFSRLVHYPPPGPCPLLYTFAKYRFGNTWDLGSAGCVSRTLHRSKLLPLGVYRRHSNVSDSCRYLDMDVHYV